MTDANLVRVLGRQTKATGRSGAAVRRARWRGSDRESLRAIGG